ncbi:MAG TPA: VOC family protein [Gaiellaceae bacterium]|jgi:catechol 2,3-dioxygenase-like lactoylglutathione lyase family enzyme
MFDHAGLNVKDYQASRDFYEGLLPLIGWGVVAEWPDHGVVGFGPEGHGMFWLHQREPYTEGAHIAFTCDDRATVDAFHAAGLAAGGTDNGPPGVRWYHENYYGAFVLDLDGNNIEAVCHHAVG